MAESVVKKVYLFKAAPEESGQFLSLTSPTSSSSSEKGRNDTRSSHTRNELERQQQSDANCCCIENSGAATLEENGDTSGNDKIPNELLRAGDDDNVGRNNSDSDTTSKDRFITLLTSVNISTELIPVLVFEYSKLDKLWEHLEHPAHYSGVVFTSPRCVEGVYEAVKKCDMVKGNWNTTLRYEWASKFLFCVGPSTISAVRQLFSPINLNLILTGDESTAESLANKIIQVNSHEKMEESLLFPCGSLRRNILKKKLDDAKIPCSECVVYDTIQNPSLQCLLQPVKNELQVHQNKTVLCFFSPSGVKFVFQHLDPSLIESYRTQVVAIGPTTREALQEFFTSKHLQVPIHQCRDPTPEALLCTLKSIPN